MATIKSHTDLKQSNILTEILPIESADLHWQYVEEDNRQLQWFCIPKDISINQHNSLPAWSVTALLSILPYYTINNNGVNIQLSVKGETLITEKGECLLDLVVNMIILLHELNLL